MSAFLVNNETISKLANELYTNYREGDNNPLKEKNTKEIAMELYKMNVKALKQRYENYDDMIVPFEYCEKAIFDSTFQLLKSLNCYLYQCSEGNVPKKELYKFLSKTVKFNVMRDIIENIPEYRNAKWD